ncbi:hypothetical protein [Rhizobium hainanense]|uniref:Chromosome partitioning protein, ParB family n=1 Tax=Rhizobium hainanense TaxID=52131 RepID=A0A1C3U5C1_9HYPH|nr:hypothetical protein [Rhizobium hainanense]SCB10632.1 chromosome partitioning protein, ParB family [Rhizobium hainanense]
MKKQAMAETAEKPLAESGWLPSVLRTTRPVGLDATPAADAYMQVAE